MKKNLFNGLLLLAVASVGVGTFSSCKDDNGDEMSVVESRVNQLEKELLDLKNCKSECAAAREALRAEIMALIQELKNKDIEQDGRLANLEAQIAKAEQDIVNLTASITALDNRINELEQFKKSFEDLGLSAEAINNWMQLHSAATNTVIEQIQGDINSIKADYATKEELNTAITNINTEIANIKNDISVKYTELSEKAQKGVDAMVWIEANGARIDALEQADIEIKAEIAKNAADIAVNTENIANNAAEIEALKTKFNELETKFNELDATVTNHTTLIAALQGDIATINEKLTNLQNDLAAVSELAAANQAAINQLTQEINKLFGLADRLNKLVTSIINQATTNPVFGSFNTPVNVRSNMLITYFGSSEKDNVFPSYSSAAEYNGDLVFTEKDMEMLQACGNHLNFAYSQGDVLMNTEDGNAGMVFLTINPNNVDFTGVNLSMVNSQDKESGMKLKNLKRSDKELYFGISRAANNGFYEAQATVDPSHVNEIAVKIEPGLKSAFKDALQNRGKKDFYQLAKKLYAQVTDILPANGLKAEWTAPDGNGNMQNYAVYSNYDIAATAVAPLSFKFMEGQSIDHKLPIITPLDEFQFDKSKFNFDIEVPEFILDDVTVNIKLDNITITPVGGIIVKIEVPKKVNSDGDVIETEIKEYDLSQDINDVLASVQQDINNTIGQWNNEIEEKFKEAFTNLKSQVQEQVDAMMNDIVGQIDKNLDNLIDEINKEVHDALGGYYDKANKVIDKYNKLADKINARLENPNYYLQSMACYQGTDGDFHQLSNSVAMPSPFKLAGGNAITIYLTTYNAEIVVPSYKKFIAVTNVWNEATGMSAQDGDAEALAVLKEANNQDCMNQPITGKQQRVALYANKAGFKYEIVYSALDYRGWTSSRKYYVSVQ